MPSSAAGAALPRVNVEGEAGERAEGLTLVNALIGIHASDADQSCLRNVMPPSVTVVTVCARGGEGTAATKAQTIAEQRVKRAIGVRLSRKRSRDSLVKFTCGWG